MTTTTPVTPAAARRRLPFTLLVLAALMAFKSLILAALAAGATFESLRPILGLTTGPELTSLIRDTPGASVFLAFFAVLLFLSVLGMLSGRRTGWLVAMVVTGLFVAIDIYGFLNGTANHLWMVLNIITVFYLNQRDVREVVGVADPEPADGAAARA